MKTLLHLVHAVASVKPLYESAMRAAGLDVDVVTVLPPAAEHGALSSAYAGLCSTWAIEGRTPREGLLHDYPGPRYGYQAHVVAAWSAGYKLIERALEAFDAHKIDGVVMLDSGHAAFDADHTASDKQLLPFVSYARSAVDGRGMIWIGHTDVPTPQTGPSAFASTTQWAAELVRLLGYAPAPKRRGESIALPGFYLEVFDEQPADKAKAEHIGALRAWGPAFAARAIKWLVESGELADTIPPPEHKALGLIALDVARSEIGVREDPPGSNDGPRIRAYRAGCERHGKALRLGPTPWCAEFVGWCDAAARGELRLAGTDIEAPVQWRAAVSELVTDAVKAKAWHVGLDGAQPGDLLIMRRDGQDPTLGGIGHVGRIESIDATSVCSIDGNHDNAVSRVTRPLSDLNIIGHIRYPR